MGTKIQLFLTRLRLFFAGYLVWPSLNGWGITLDRPNGDYEKQAKWLLPYLQSRFDKTHFVHGPTMAAGGALAVYLWPKSDPRARAQMEDSDASTSSR